MKEWYQQIDGAQLRQLRRDRMLSQVELAALARTTQPAISDFETNSGRLAQHRTVRKMADALGVEPKELLAQQESR